MYAARVICLIGALALSIESLLSLQGKSLCKTTACEIVGKYLIFPETVLVGGGALFFWFLTLLFFFSYRYPKQLKQYPFIILALAMAFDGGLIGFQFFTIQQKCALCLAVAGFLIFITLIYCLAHRRIVILFCCLAAWFGAFSANGIIEMPAPTGAASKMIFFKKPGTITSNSPATTKTLIFSMECPHCLDIIEKLATIDSRSHTWQLAAIDQDDVSMTKISKFIELAPQADNPFQLLLKLKKEKINQTVINKTINQQTKKALSFLGNLDIYSVPTLLIETSTGKKEILTGSKSIHQHLNELKPKEAARQIIDKSQSSAHQEN